LETGWYFVDDSEWLLAIALVAIAFSPDGQTIASANEDKTVILWNKEQVLTLNPLMYGCNWVHDYLKTNPNVNESDRHLCDWTLFEYLFQSDTQGLLILLDAPESEYF
jgi:WD40 repeat protein